MLSLIYLSLYAAFGLFGGNTFRVLRQRREVGFQPKHWALFVATIALAMLFARFVINSRGSFGRQPEIMLYVGALLLAVCFFLGGGAFTRLTQR